MSSSGTTSTRPYCAAAAGFLLSVLVVVFAFTALLAAQERPEDEHPATQKQEEPKEAKTLPTSRPATQPRDGARTASASSPDERDRRLEQIEKSLRESLKELEALRGGQTGATETPAAPEPAPPSPAQKLALDSKWINALSWRSIGPAGMGGRIVDFAVVDSDPSTYWVATASGGLLKTTNNGVSFSHQFDHEATVSIGAVTVAPSDPHIVWVGTGEGNPRNSVSYGDGVYKSTDGGKTWKNMGLKKTFQIGRILISRNDPNVVYVGALGRLYGSNEDRGVYKTSDGGETWQKILYIDDKTGVIDMQMHPTDADTLIVAMWERRRDGYDSHPSGKMPDGYDGYDPIEKWGKGAGLYKTTDGGKNWHKLAKGLPSSNMGRIGIDYYRKDPNVVFAIIDCATIGMGKAPKQQTPVYVDISGEDAEGGVKLTEVRDNGPFAKAGVEVDDMLQLINNEPIEHSDELADKLREHKVGDKLKVKISRGGQALEFDVTLIERPPNAFGGRGGRGGGGGGGGGFGGRGGQQTGPYAGLSGEDAEGGVRLSSVIDEGPAEKAGLREGDIITSLGDKKIESYEQLVEELQSKKVGDKIEVKYRRGDEQRDVQVTLAERPQRQGGGTLGPGGGANPKRPGGGIYAGQLPNIQDEQGENSYEYGGIYKSTDGGESWTRINSLNPRPMYFGLLRVDPSDDKYLYVGGVSMYRSTDGGKTFRADAGRGVHADQHAMWIDPRDGRHMIVGCDGGFYASYDRANSWDHLNTMAIAQFYHVVIRPTEPYWVVGGLQDNGSWAGPTVSLDGQGPINEDWISVGGGDGFQCAADANDPNVVYSESQDGAITRRNLRTGERAAIRPQRAQGAPAYHFNWNTPFILSHHNSRILYSAGNYVFRSLDRGNDLRVASPQITLTPDGTATALAESPRNPDVLYVGTDDGALWITRDGCRTWTEIARNVGLPGRRWVATIEASPYVEGRAYVVFDGHRSDDDEPYVAVTEDFGRTWRSLRGNLPWGSTRCLREDITSPNILYVGTEFGAWVSLDRGLYWNKFGGNLPTVAVHEFAQHPVNGEIVAATHGRSLWVVDVSALRQIKAEYLAENPQLYQPPTFVRWHSEPSHAGTNRRFMGQNPTFGAQIYYSLPKHADNVSLKILDISGATLREFPGKKEAGLYRITWDLRPTPRTPGSGGPTTRSATQRSTTRQAGDESPASRPLVADAGADPDAPATRPATRPTTRASRAGRGGFAGAGRGGRGGRGAVAGAAGSPAATGGRGPGGFGRIATVPPGAYRLILTVDGKEFVQTLHIEPDPIVSDSVVLASNTPDLGEDEEEEEKREAMGIPRDSDEEHELEEQRERSGGSDIR